MKAGRLVEILSFQGAVLIAWCIVLEFRFGIAGDVKPGDCPNEDECRRQSRNCSICTFPSGCKYGDRVSVTCTTNASVQCHGNRSWTEESNCMFCYQVDPKYHVCETTHKCDVTAAPPTDLITTKCTVMPNVTCIGRREFLKRVPCWWTSGRYKWSTALILSITLGGFGVDRFYLGLWRSGLGKLFSFGGLGVWTIIDVILIATGYVRPHDDSLYMY